LLSSSNKNKVWERQLKEKSFLFFNF
jgi:hypothetical protein